MKTPSYDLNARDIAMAMDAFFPRAVELHLNTAPLKGYAKKLRKIGAKYSECRGYGTTRFVTIGGPDTHKELIEELQTKFNAKVMIFRLKHDTGHFGKDRVFLALKSTKRAPLYSDARKRYLDDVTGIKAGYYRQQVLALANHRVDKAIYGARGDFNALLAGKAAELLDLDPGTTMGPTVARAVIAKLSKKGQ